MHNIYWVNHNFISFCRIFVGWLKVEKSLAETFMGGEHGEEGGGRKKMEDPWMGLNFGDLGVFFSSCFCSFFNYNILFIN